ncbi:hypothetical protein [Thioclava sp.]|uniref:hypothetical protein n=1 Tax=Thioclava sp. TaxID=1933450 RepID=UPI003242D5DA
MLSYTVPAVGEAEAAEYTSAAGVTPQPSATDLIRGQRYIAARFNSRWLSEWEGNLVPDAVKHAIIEAAVIEARRPGSLSPVSTPATDKVLIGAGKLTWERVKGASGPDAFIPRSAIIDGLLAGLVRSAMGSVSFLMRA